MAIVPQHRVTGSATLSQFRDKCRELTRDGWDLFQLIFDPDADNKSGGESWRYVAVWKRPHASTAGEYLEYAKQYERNARGRDGHEVPRRSSEGAAAAETEG